MRVTTLTASAQLGGTERVLLDFAQRASHHGIELAVIAPAEGPLLDRLKSLRVPADVVPAPGGLLRSSQRRGGLWGAMPGLAASVSWSRAVSRHPSWRDADVIYTVGFKPHLAASLARRHPVVWHLHELPPGVTGIAWRWLARRLPDALIANSHATANEWVKRKARRDKGMTVVHNGVDPDHFKPRPPTGWIHEQLGVPRAHRLLGMPAVFARWKGQMEVAEAFSVVRQRLSEVHLVLVGGDIYDTGAEERFGVELRDAIETQEHVHLFPFQEQIEQVYPELDLVLHYSVRPEPFGRVILESMASGVPVIAGAEGGPLEILGAGEAGKGKGGWLVQPRDPRLLAEAICQALSLRPDELTAVGAEGRERAVDHFLASAFAARVAEVLRSVHRPR